MKRPIVYCLISLLATAPALAQLLPQSAAPKEAPEIALWPEGKVPGKVSDEAEAEVPSRGDGVQRITHTSRPTLTFFPADHSGEAAPVMIVCPGGGYRYVTFNKEGTEVAEWLNTLGISALVLKYRTPGNREGALQDLQRALSLVRANAAEWRIDPDRVGVIGFSAGGHLAAVASTRTERAYAPVDAVDDHCPVPDFAVLLYPAYLNKGDAVAPELQVRQDLPPTLIIHSDDDRRFIPGSRIYAAALESAGAPHQFICYETGGHGYGLHSTREAKAWPEAAARWLEAR